MLRIAKSRTTKRFPAAGPVLASTVGEITALSSLASRLDNLPHRRVQQWIGVAVGLGTGVAVGGLVGTSVGVRVGGRVGVGTGVASLLQPEAATSVARMAPHTRNSG